MSYHLRVFCRSAVVPPLADLFDAARQRGIELSLDPQWVDDVDVLSPAWSEAAVLYTEAATPLFWTIDRADEPDGTLGEEVQEFLELIEDVGDTPERRRVVEHLERTVFLFTARLPLDGSDTALHATDAAVRVLVERCAGMVQADGEGFYLDGELRVPIDDG